MYILIKHLKLVRFIQPMIKIEMTSNIASTILTSDYAKQRSDRGKDENSTAFTIKNCLRKASKAETGCKCKLFNTKYT